MDIMAYFNSLNLATLPGRIPAGAAQGLIWGLMALGVYITFRILNIADLTVDGSFTTGGAVTVMLILGGYNPVVALLAAMITGTLAGMCTGLLHTKLGIPPILAGILTQFSLYSINLRIMGSAANKALNADKYNLIISSRNISPAIITGILLAIIFVAVLYWFFGTEKGTALRATGNNPLMSSAQGINIDTMKVLGLGLSNALVALSGGFISQFQGFADINMGRGAIVIGLAAVIIGEVLYNIFFKKHGNFAISMLFVVFGGVVYYIVVVLVLWLKLPSNDLKLFTAVIVAVFLAVPYLQAQAKSSFKRLKKDSKKLSDEGGMSKNA